jgi:hypothetical protein
VDFDDLAVVGELVEVAAYRVLGYVELLAEICRQYFVMNVDLIDDIFQAFLLEHGVGLMDAGVKIS